MIPGKIEAVAIIWLVITLFSLLTWLALEAAPVSWTDVPREGVLLAHSTSGAEVTEVLGPMSCHSTGSPQEAQWSEAEA